MAATTFMATLDMTVVTVALPTMTRDLDVSPAVSEWLVLAYLLPLVGLSMPAGRWIDSAPWRPCMTVSLLGFACSSVMVGLSSNAATAIASRAAQGTFAALVLALAPAVVSKAVAPTSQGRAMGVMVAVGGMGAVSGYAAGALLLDTLGWPWAFHLNVPIALGVLGVTASVMPASRTSLRPPTIDMATEAVTLLLAVGAVLTGLSLAASHGPGGLMIALAAVAPALLWARSAAGRQAVARLRVPPVRRAHLSLALESSAFAGASFALPFVLEAHGGGSVRHVALTLVALPITAMIGSLLGGVVADRTSARRTATAGACVLAAGLGVLALSRTSWEPRDFVGAIAVAGMGGGAFASANQALAMTAAASGDAASTGASTNVARQLGFAVGPAVVTAIWAIRDYAVAGLSLGFGTTAIVALGAALVLTDRRGSRMRAATPQRGNPVMIDPEVNVAVIYYSQTGTVHALAEAAAEGAVKSGAQVRLLRVSELADDNVVSSKPEWRRHLESVAHVPLAEPEDLVWADAVLLGTPTRYGTAASQLQQFIDTTGPVWQQGHLTDKVYSAFTAGGTMHGGQESTLLVLHRVFTHWGGIIVPPGYTHPVQFEVGNPYGASYVAAGTPPDDVHLEAARYQARRVVEVARMLKTGRAAA